MPDNGASVNWLLRRLRRSSDHRPLLDLVDPHFTDWLTDTEDSDG